MTIKQVRKYFRKKIKPLPIIYKKNEYYDWSPLPIEKQIEDVEEKGPGIYTFFYMKCKEFRVVKNKPTDVSMEIVKEKISVTEN